MIGGTSMQTIRDFNRKTVTAVVKSDLLGKIEESQTRGWRVIGELQQLSNGHWSCLMAKDER